MGNNQDCDNPRIDRFEMRSPQRREDLSLRSKRADFHDPRQSKSLQRVFMLQKVPFRHAVGTRLD